MTIASEITRINGNIADAYTAISTAGGTLPATQNSDNLATAIATISGGGGGGGDTVLAINDTGSTISQGDKVWLNKHNNPSVTGTDYTSNSTSSYVSFIMIGNVPYSYNTKNSNLTQYSFSNGAWSGQEVQNNLSSNCTNPCFIGAQPIIRGMGTGASYMKDLIINTDGLSYVTGNATFYIGNDRCIKQTSDKHYSIVEYDHATGTEGSTLGTLTSTQNLFHNVFIDGNTLMLATIVSHACLMEYYDISDLTSITKIASITCPETTTYFYYATGLNVGDYVFFQSAANNTNWQRETTPTLRIYKLGANFTLEAANDLPLQLQVLNRTAAVARYDSRTKYLTVGTHDNVYFFEFDTTTKTFSQFLLDVTMPTDAAIYDDCTYVGAISGDKTNVVITYRRTSGSSYYYPAIKKYKLSNADNTEWYAEPYGNFNVSTLTGYATGNTQDSKYEIATVLPETVQVEVNGGDEVEYFGGAE